jgi:hypothetical protein
MLNLVIDRDKPQWDGGGTGNGLFGVFPAGVFLYGGITDEKIENRN